MLFSVNFGRISGWKAFLAWHVVINCILEAEASGIYSDEAASLRKKQLRAAGKKPLFCELFGRRAAARRFFD